MVAVLFGFTASLFPDLLPILPDLLMSQSPPEYKITKHPDYRAISATGLFGILIPTEGQVVFYTDRLEPKSDTVGTLSLGSVNRELQAEVHLSPATFKSIAEWMTQKVKEFEQQQKQQITSVKMEQAPGKYT